MNIYTYIHIYLHKYFYIGMHNVRIYIHIYTDLAHGLCVDEVLCYTSRRGSRPNGNIYTYIHPQTHIYIHIYLSIYLFIYLSIYLSIYRSIRIVRTLRMTLAWTKCVLHQSARQWFFSKAVYIYIYIYI